MKIIFFGTPDYVLPILKALKNHYEIAAVVTQSPKPAGRKQKLTYSPIDKFAHTKHIPIYYDFQNLPQAELGVCAAYGAKIPKQVINSLKYGILNIHPSLLPKLRGASPVSTAIVQGLKVTGVTIIKMDEKIDHGPIVTRFKQEIMPQDTTKSLRERLFTQSAKVLIELIPNYTKGKITLKNQDDNQATFTKTLTKKDGFVDLKKEDPQILERKLRAYFPWPGIWTFVGEKRLKILKAHLDIKHQTLVIDTVQLEGKNPVSWKQFKEAYPKTRF